ncbi:CRISPR system precrRNA processing endoribonuclease RAMP protein Cas6 [Nonomuraea sp. NPDC049419]|uniref:CRISPR system precrRNA processing endoribonuclease RAMP protein Cas6 n=1 Tax=Nonomuraea sp. NPDC049419 TaxID=3155772 RepID=UPI00341569D2
MESSMMAFVLRLKCRGAGIMDARKLHGLACSLFERNADHSSQVKPFAVWPLRRDSMGRDEMLILRCNWLRDSALPFDPEGLSTVRLGARTCSVVGFECHEESFDSLAEGPTVGEAVLTFLSPVFFAANGRRSVAPDPRLILGGYRRRWNEALPPGSPYWIDEELWRATHQATELHSFDLRTVMRDGGHGHEVSGFVGTARLRVLSDEVKETFSRLVRFASYCGTGARTTYGFGATTVTFPGSWDG